MDQNDPTQELTLLIGCEVYSSNGVFVGEIEDLRLDLKGEAVTGLALRNANEDLFGQDIRRTYGAIIPYRWIESVEDVVVIYDIVERIKTRDEKYDMIVI